MKLHFFLLTAVLLSVSGMYSMDQGEAHHFPQRMHHEMSHRQGMGQHGYNKQGAGQHQRGMNQNKRDWRHRAGEHPFHKGSNAQAHTQSM